MKIILLLLAFAFIIQYLKSLTEKRKIENTLKKRIEYSDKIRALQLEILQVESAIIDNNIDYKRTSFTARFYEIADLNHKLENHNHRLDSLQANLRMIKQ